MTFLVTCLSRLLMEMFVWGRKMICEMSLSFLFLPGVSPVFEHTQDWRLSFKTQSALELECLSVSAAATVHCYSLGLGQWWEGRLCLFPDWILHIAIAWIVGCVKAGSENGVWNGKRLLPNVRKERCMLRGGCWGLGYWICRSRSVEKGSVVEHRGPLCPLMVSWVISSLPYIFLTFTPSSRNIVS